MKNFNFSIPFTSERVKINHCDTNNNWELEDKNGSLYYVRFDEIFSI